jgi:FkbM family methyltransferase
VSLRFDLANHVDRLVYIGAFEPLNVVWFRRILREGDTVIDAGANIGFFSFLAARCVGESGRVLAFEPHPFNYDPFAAAVTAHRLHQIAPFQVGLDETDGSGTVHMRDQSVYPNRTGTMIDCEGDAGIAVPTRSIDSLVDEHGIERIDLLKVDVDGFETRILRGAARTLAAGKIRHVIIELSSFWLERSGSSEAEIRALLGAGGLTDVSARDWLLCPLLGQHDHLFARA